MSWIEFSEPEAPLSFKYPDTWTLVTEESLQLLSPEGSAITWSVFGSDEHLGDTISRSEQELPAGDSSGRSWTISRRHVILMVTYFADPQVAERERAQVDQILESACPDPDLPPDAESLVADIELGLKQRFPDKRVARQGFGVTVEELGVLNLSNIYRSLQVEPDARETQIEKCIDTFTAVQHSEEILADYARASERLFPLLVPHDPSEPDDTRLMRRVGDGLAVAYSVDFGPIMARVTREQLVTWGVDASLVHEHALRNLSRDYPLELHRVEREQVPCAMTDRFTFATAQVLLPEFHASLSPHLGEAFLIAMPSRDFVVATAEAHKDELQRFAAEDYEREPHPWTPRIFRCSAGKLEAVSEEKGLLARLFGN